jgi:hypothetical protein
MTVSWFDYGTTQPADSAETDSTPLNLVSVATWGGDVEAPDPLVLTWDKARALDAEARAANRSRFRPWSDVRNALRNKSL